MRPTAEASTSDGLARTLEFLEGADVGHTVIGHSPTFSACESARVAYQPCEMFAKSVLLWTGAGHALAVLPAAQRLDLAKARAALGGRRGLRLATEGEMAAAFPGFAVGALPPLGRLLGVPGVVDPRLLTYNHVLCAGGDHSHSLWVDPIDLARLNDERVVDVCREPAHR